MIKVLVKEPGKEFEEKEVENKLEDFQELVGGYIETVTIATDLVLICNEEGRLKNLPYNCEVLGRVFIGTIVLAGVKKDEFSDCPISPRFAEGFLSRRGLRNV